MSLRFRLTLGLIAVILLAYAFLSVVVIQHVNRVFLHEVQNRVRLDLNSARRVFDGHAKQILERLETVRDLHQTELNIQHLKDDIHNLFSSVQNKKICDLMLLVNPEGEVIFRAHQPDNTSGDYSQNPLVEQVLQTRAPATGAFLAPLDQLTVENPELAARANIQLIETPAAKPTDAVELNQGMVLGAAVPIYHQSDPNQLLAVAYGAILLNRRYDLVDAIRDEIYQEPVEGKHIGMATVFQGDVRIATNVPTVEQGRAEGTRLSEVVYQRVLENGEVFADKAFVVNDWYITAYEPIRDPSGAIIGALYVGLLETPFTQPQRVIIIFFLLMVLSSVLATLILLSLLIKRLLAPIAPIMKMAHRVIEGDLSARVGIRPKDDMGVLCEAIDLMADAVAQREAMIKQHAHQQISQSEKLASIGRLAAGVAHEINNPLTGVLTFAHLLREKPNLTGQDKDDLNVIVNETTRVREIVRGLLDFARESPSKKEPLQVNDVIMRAIKLVGANKEFRNITIQTALDAQLPLTYGDPNQLLQVVLNLCLNACEAMPSGGQLTINSEQIDDRVIVTIQDTGCGIIPDNLEKIFDPFFTTKPVGKGTGLGLSVSYGILKAHGGMLECESEFNVGTTFTLSLLLENQQELNQTNSE
ncbi:MAG: cache domain-containing protein [Candidatus Hinthialibacter antarcticus]|nr:cache domain-containing protein [Candidatus Hinthialibacter antarcticus]